MRRRKIMSHNKYFAMYLNDSSLISDHALVTGPDLE